MLKHHEMRDRAGLFQGDITSTGNNRGVNYGGGTVQTDSNKDWDRLTTAFANIPLFNPIKEQKMTDNKILEEFSKKGIEPNTALDTLNVMRYILSTNRLDIVKTTNVLVDGQGKSIADE